MEINSYVNSTVMNQPQNSKVESATPQEDVESIQSVSQALKQEVETREVASKNQDNSSDINKVVENLNDSLGPFNTKIKFGVDKDDIYYVSVLEASTNKVLRRFPKEQAELLVPKLQEVAGVLFDEKG